MITMMRRTNYDNGQWYRWLFHDIMVFKDTKSPSAENLLYTFLTFLLEQICLKICSSKKKFLLEQILKLRFLEIT